MSHRISIAVAPAAFVAMSLLTAPAAHAEDHRPCVSKVEYQSSPSAIRIRGEVPRTPTRAELEAQWGVTGLGVRDPDLSGRYLVGYEYPACGYSFAEAQVWVLYNRVSHQSGAIHRYVEPGATPHGRP